MDVKKIFRTVSRQMLESFAASAEIHHLGNMGSFRENTLRDFLQRGRLPGKYDVGNGEIISPNSQTSKQSDLIIYDKLSGISLLYSEAVQVYPIESVYGVIEVKSSLGKTELVEALENIKSVKSIASRETVEERMGGGVFRMSYRRPAPFGMVFAYRLSGNSLNSLENNLIEWQANNAPEYWPNAIVVLNEGIIYHTKRFKHCYENDEIDNSASTIGLHYKNDTLFHFYSILLQLCSSMNLGPLRLDKYFDPAEKIGNYVVRNHNRFQNGKDKSVSRLTETFIEMLVNYCKTQQKITQRELLLMQFGMIPEGMEDSDLSTPIYFYNPDNLKGIHEVTNPFTDIEGRPHAAEGVMVPLHNIIVDDDVIFFPLASLKKGDTELIKGKTIDDL
jgi:hypothetical protein